MEFTLLAAVATAAAAIWLANRVWSTASVIDHPTDRLTGAALAGVLVGRIAAMTEAGVNVFTHPADVIIIRGGVDTGWAALGALAVLTWAARTHLPTALDALAGPALAGLAGWHAGCLWRGACLGTATDLPWAMTSPGTTVGRHPVELYAALALIAGAVVTARFRTRPWLATGMALAWAGGVRLATQPLRLSITGGPVWWYAVAVVVGVALALAGHRVIRTRPPSPSTMEM